MTIHFNLFDPANSIFKTKASDRAEYQIIECSNSENCGLFARGECVLSGIFPKRCNYGKCSREIGHTKRTKKYYEWIAQAKEKYEGVGTMESPTQKMSEVGEYIYFPYPHWYLSRSFDGTDYKGNALIGGRTFIKKEDFTLGFIKKVLQARPIALFGDEITSYQKEFVPKIKLHLKEEFPELYGQLPKELKLKKINHVGREAYVVTLPPNQTLIFGTKNYPHEYYWDGKTLTERGDKMTFNGVNGMKSFELKITPDENTSVKVTKDTKFDENTKFKD